MHRFRTAERIPVFARTARQTGLWLLPCACVLVVSATVAFAGEQAAERTFLDRLAALAIVDASTASGALISTGATGVQALSGSQWVLLLSANPETRVSCLTTKDRVSADMLYVHPEELDRLAAEVCDSARQDTDTCLAAVSAAAHHQWNGRRSLDLESQSSLAEQHLCGSHASLHD